MICFKLKGCFCNILEDEGVVMMFSYSLKVYRSPLLMLKLRSVKFDFFCLCKFE